MYKRRHKCLPKFIHITTHMHIFIYVYAKYINVSMCVFRWVGIYDAVCIYRQRMSLHTKLVTYQTYIHTYIRKICKCIDTYINSYVKAFLHFYPRLYIHDYRIYIEYLPINIEDKCAKPQTSRNDVTLLEHIFFPSEIRKTKCAYRRARARYNHDQLLQ